MVVLVFQKTQKAIVEIGKEYGEDMYVISAAIAAKWKTKEKNGRKK